MAQLQSRRASRLVSFSLALSSTFSSCFLPSHAVDLPFDASGCKCRHLSTLGQAARVPGMNKKLTGARMKERDTSSSPCTARQTLLVHGSKKNTCGSTVFSTGHPRQYSLAPAMLVCADRTRRGRFIAVWPQMQNKVVTVIIYPSTNYSSYLDLLRIVKHGSQNGRPSQGWVVSGAVCQLFHSEEQNRVELTL